MYRTVWSTVWTLFFILTKKLSALYYSLSPAVSGGIRWPRNHSMRLFITYFLLLSSALSGECKKLVQIQERIIYLIVCLHRNVWTAILGMISQSRLEHRQHVQKFKTRGPFSCERAPVLCEYDYRLFYKRVVCKSSCLWSMVFWCFFTPRSVYFNRNLFISAPSTHVYMLLQYKFKQWW